MSSLLARIKRFIGGDKRKERDPDTLSINPVTIRTQRINRGVEEGIEKHGYRGNPEVDNKWPAQRPSG